MIVMCEIEDCAYCRDGQCGKEIISIDWKSTSYFERGERVSFPACEDYKEIGEDDGAD